jgi:hypothetical protein
MLIGLVLYAPEGLIVTFGHKLLIPCCQALSKRFCIFGAWFGEFFHVVFRHWRLPIPEESETGPLWDLARFVLFKLLEERLEGVWPFIIVH